MPLKRNIISLVLGMTIALAGCKTTQPKQTAGAQNTATQNTVIPISYITMKFPKQIQWTQAQSKSFENGDMVAGWITKGSTPQNTPVTIIYNKVAQKSDLRTFLQGALKPLQGSCPDLKITNLKPVSKHRNQFNLEAICSRLGKNNFGVLYYITALADGRYIHMIRSETKTIPSAKAGILNPRNQTERNMVNRSAGLINIMNQFRLTIRACNVQKNCW